MRPPYLLRRYAFAWAFLGVFVAAQIGYALLSPQAQGTVTTWASTSVANLETDPVGCLIFSAVIAGGTAWAWPAIIAAALFPAVRVAGNRRTILVCVAGHVVGTLVSEGIVAYRVHAGALPESARHLVDVGPSYIVVAALVLTLLHGWRSGPLLAVRGVAALDLALLIFPGDIFSGLSTLVVSAIGHVVAMTTAGLAEVVSEGVAHANADQVGDRSGSDAEQKLAEGAAPERPLG